MFLGQLDPQLLSRQSRLLARAVPALLGLLLGLVSVGGPALRRVAKHLVLQRRELLLKAHQLERELLRDVLTLGLRELLDRVGELSSQPRVLSRVELGPLLRGLQIVEPIELRELLVHHA